VKSRSTHRNTLPRRHFVGGFLLGLSLVVTTGLGLTAIGTAVAGNMPPELMRERFVEDNVFTSTHAPSVRIAVDRQLQFLGQIDFSSGSDETERYLFGATRDQTVERLFVVEVAASEARHSEDASGSVDEIEIDGATYRHTTRAFNNAEQIRQRPAAAMARTTAYLEQQGLSLPSELVTSRLARTADPERRKQISILYFEDLKLAGRSLDEVDGQLTADLTERFLASFRILDR